MGSRSLEANDEALLFSLLGCLWACQDRRVVALPRAWLALVSGPPHTVRRRRSGGQEPPRGPVGYARDRLQLLPQPALGTAVCFAWISLAEPAAPLEPVPRLSEQELE